MKLNSKTLVFDMDGTLADLYSVTNWLPKLRAHDATPYRDAKPLCDMHALRKNLLELKAQGWKVIVVTWLSKDSNLPADFVSESVRQKVEWLTRHAFPYDTAFCVPYGVPKHALASGILFDDNKDVRAEWEGLSVDPCTYDMVEFTNRLAS